MFTIGTDIEYFIKNKQNLYLNPIMFSIGEKDTPRMIGNFKMHRDNLSVEIATPICYTKEQFIKNVKSCLEIVQKKVSPYQVSTESVVSFPEELRNTKQGKEFACDPDFNVYTHSINEINKKTSLRGASGHIHVGHKALSDEDTIEKFIKHLDNTLGQFLINLDIESFKLRAKECGYGKLGNFRFTEYGVEYRTPSNVWTFDDNNIEQVYDFIKDAVETVLEKEEEKQLILV
jgi:hypothetical protein